MSPTKVAVVGGGVAGLAAAQQLSAQGFSVTIYDQRVLVPSELGIEPPPAVVTDSNEDELAARLIAEKPSLVVVSPGIPQHSALFKGPYEAGLEVIGEVELAWRLGSQARGSSQDDPVLTVAAGRGAGPDYQETEKLPKWLAVTGTNGKTTTVGMTEAILRASGIDALQAGNVGYPVTTAAAERHSVLVTELSSFQLATTVSMRPWASICLNVDSDHLDWHGSVEAYRAAKARVYDRTLRARLYFEDDPLVSAMASAAGDTDSSALVPLVFGGGHSGSVGLESGLLVDGVFQGPDTQVICDLREVPLLSSILRHEDGSRSPLVRDALAASALALSVGATGEAIVAGLAGFRSAPHRYEVIPTEDGISWVDDSKATNAHAAAAALRNVPVGRAIWIVGGDAKGQSLRELIRDSAPSIKAAVVIGAEQHPILTDFAAVAPSSLVVAVTGEGQPEQWMADVVRACRALAAPGDTVLLAPACASWDQFKSYGQRGDIFRAAVETAEQTGE